MTATFRPQQLAGRDEWRAVLVVLYSERLEIFRRGTCYRPDYRDVSSPESHQKDLMGAEDVAVVDKHHYFNLFHYTCCASLKGLFALTRHKEPLLLL